MTDGYARSDGRAPNELRPVRITPGFLPNAEGSALIETGDTHVICSATVSQGVPRWLQGQGKGWITAEYAMLPRSTTERVPRDRDGRVGGRTQEIQRLIGRSLRGITDLAALGETLITVDCDVLRADGGTRTAAITGAYVALHQAVESLIASGRIEKNPLRSQIAATSVGILEEHEILDLSYEEDSSADVDLNVVMTGSMEFVEVQGTAEGTPFSRGQLDRLIGLAEDGIKQLLIYQQEAIRVGA